MTNRRAGTQPQAHTGDNWQAHKAARDVSAALIRARRPELPAQYHCGNCPFDAQCRTLQRLAPEMATFCELDDSEAGVSSEPQSSYSDTWLHLLHEPLRPTYEWIALKDGE